MVPVLPDSREKTLDQLSDEIFKCETNRKEKFCFVDKISQIIIFTIAWQIYYFYVKPRPKL